MAKILSIAEVASNNKPDKLWIVVDEDVYDLTRFQDEHPGNIHRNMQLYYILLTRPRWQEESVCYVCSRISLLTHHSSPKGCWQGRIQAVLEISQRGRTQEIQGKASGRLSGHQAKGRRPANSSSNSTSHRESRSRGAIECWPSRPTARTSCASSY